MKETYLHARKRGHSVVENALLDDCQLSMQAKYLLIQLCSHREGEWKINMPDIIKRSKNGRDAHYTALNELIHNHYAARVKVLQKGKHDHQVYVFGQVKEDVSEMLEDVIKTEESNGFTCRVEFGEPVPENQDTVKSNMESQYNINNQEQNTKNKINNLNIDNIDDDKRTSLQEDSTVHNEKSVNSIIASLKEATKQDLTDRSFNSVVRKVIDKYNQGKINNFRDYLVTALNTKIQELELRRIKDQAQKNIAIKQPHSQQDQQPYERKVPFYNWLDN